MADSSPYEQAKELVRQLNSILSALDLDDLPRDARDLAIDIKQLFDHVRLGARDYDYADTRYEQEQSAVETKQYLDVLQAKILKASEYNLFGAVDVAHASARIQQIVSKLQ